MKTYGDNTLDLLNVGIDDFYSYNVTFIEERKVIEFKAMFITFINQLERVFNGSFGKAFQIEDDEDFALFKEMFPVINDIATNDSGREGIVKLCAILSVFRNLNAHAFCNCDYANDLDAKYILDKLPNFNDSVKYVADNGVPTLGGMITLLFFLSNDSSISYFIKNGVWQGFIDNLNYFGKDYIPDRNSFPELVMRVSKINDEVEIRKPSDSSRITDAIFGRFANKVKHTGSLYTYFNGEDDEDSSFHISLTIENDGDEYSVSVLRGSNYLHYFKTNFAMKIRDVNGFIEWSKKLPPFISIVFLYRMRASEYKQDTLDETILKLSLKLNKPKFYVDKNIDTLLLSEGISDIRMGGQIASIGINYCLYMFEMVTYKRREISYETYSALKIAMLILNLSRGIINKMVAIRNFFSHYYIIGDEHVVGDSSATIDMSYIINCFVELANELRISDSFKARNITNDFFYRVIHNLFLFKYSDVCQKGKEFTKSPNIDTYVAYTKTMSRTKRSFIVTDTEELIKKEFRGKHFHYYDEQIDYVQEYVIRANGPVVFWNGVSIDGTVTLYSMFEMNPRYFLKTNRCSLVSENKKGLVIERVYEVEC